MRTTRTLFSALLFTTVALPLNAQDARITVQNDEGREVVVTVNEGRVVVDGETVFSFEDANLGAMLSSIMSAADLEALGQLEGLDLSELMNEALAGLSLEETQLELLSELRALAGDRLSEIDAIGVDLNNAMIHRGDLHVRPGDRIEGDVVVLDGDAQVFGMVNGDLVVVDGDALVFESGRVLGDAVSIGGAVPSSGGVIVGETISDAVEQNAASSISIGLPAGPSFFGVIGSMIALLGVGFGLTHFFAEPLDILSGTVSDAGGKSFLAGAFSIPLIPVAMVVGVIGLCITVVGILLIPFALVAALGVLGLVAVSGYLACAQALGRRHTRKQIAAGQWVPSGPFRDLVYGLVLLISVWVPASLLGWVPVVGSAALVLAWSVTLVAVTTGLGAAVLSRKDLRDVLIKSQRRSLTDEYPVISSGRR